MLDRITATFDDLYSPTALAADRQPPAPTRAFFAYFLRQFRGALIARFALVAGGSVADLTVALALHAFAALHPERAEIATLVPVSPRRDKNEVKRNHVSMVRVAVPVSLGLDMPVDRLSNSVGSALGAGVLQPQ